MGMICDIKKHEDFVRQELDNKNRDRLKDLLAFHRNQVRNFQHERLIHLLVTLTFGLASLISFAITLFFSSIAMMILDAIFFITLLFYVKHYFYLENGVQRLYRLDREIIEKM